MSVLWTTWEGEEMGLVSLSMPMGKKHTHPQAPEFEPAAILQIEISRPLPTEVPVSGETGRRYRRALVLVLLHMRPLGIIELSADEDGITIDHLARGIWEQLGPQINAHLREDGLPQLCQLGPEGLTTTGVPHCSQNYESSRLACVPLVSVVIPTHNRPQQVVTLVHSVLASDYSSAQYEIIVVDNAPADNDLAQIIREHFPDCSQVRYLREDRAGSAHARNRGLACARGEIVVFVDDDELVDEHWLTQMVRGFEVSKNIACVTGLIIPMESETHAQGWFEQFGGYCKQQCARRLFNLTDHRAPTPLYPYSLGVFGAGGSMAFRRSTLLELGGFDPALGPATPTLGGEDIDAMLRVILEGYSLLYEPAAIVRHPPYREYSQLRRQILGYGTGLTACLFKNLVSTPRLLPDFIKKLPHGLLYAFSSRSPHHAGKQAGYPKELTWLELRGLLYGPLAYLRSRRQLAITIPPNVLAEYGEESQAAGASVESEQAGGSPDGQVSRWMRGVGNGTRRISRSARRAGSRLSNRLRTDSLLRNSVYVMTSTALTAASGYLYWIIAAHIYPAHDVGLASALIGTMMLCATLANLGIGPTLIQVLPRRQNGGEWSVTLNAVFLTGSVSSVLIGSVAAVVLPLVAPKFAEVSNHGGYTLVLLAGVPMLTLAALLDSTFTAERAAGNMLTRTVAFALLRIPLLVIPIVLGRTGALVICVSWILAAFGSIIGGALLIPRLGRAYRLAWRGILVQIRSMLSLVAGHQFISLGALAPIYLMPVFVVARLSFAENAYFYTSWQVGSLFFMVSPSVATALLAEGSNTPKNVLRKARSSLFIIAALLCPAMLVAFLGGHLILSMFGLNYSLYGYTLLTVLVLSAIPDAITNVYVSVLRVQKRLVWAALLNIGMAAIALAGAWFLLPQMGIIGAGWAWLIAQTAGTVAVLGHIAVVHLRSHMDQRRNLWPADAGLLRILLIVDPCSAGEAMRLSPYVSMIRRQRPHSHITMVANEDALAGFDRLLDIDRVVKSKIYVYRPYSRARVRICQVFQWLSLVWQLGFGYDRVITFYWGGLLQHALGYTVGNKRTRRGGEPGRRVAYSNHPQLVTRWLLSDCLGTFDRTKSYPLQHAALIRAAGIELDEDAQPCINLTDGDKLGVTHLLQEHNLASGERFIVLHPGSDWACQQWLEQRWAKLADALLARYNAAIVFTGSSNEVGYIEGIQQRMQASSLSLAGRTTLPQVAALLARSLLCVTVDVAIFELTQAVGIPTVVLAGPSRPETGSFGTWQPIIVRRTSESLAARIVECQDDHNARNVRSCWNYQCEMASMRQITVAEVLKAVEVQMSATEVQPAPPETGQMLAAEAVPPLELHPMLQETFSALNQGNIRWCVLRGEENLHDPGDDVDLLIAPEDLVGATAVLLAHHYIALPSFGRGSHSFFVGYHPGTETWITLDIVTELTHGRYLSMPTYAADGCLSRRQPAGALNVLASDDAFWTLFLHCLLDKGTFASHRAARLEQLSSRAGTDGPLARLAGFACPRAWSVARLLEAARCGDWDELTQLAPMFARGWHRRQPMRAWWRGSLNHAGQWLEIPLVRLRRPGVSVALLGPDGAGKSTLAAEISHRFHFPVRSVYMGLWKSGRPESEANRQHPVAWIVGRGIEIAGRMPRAWGRYLVAKQHQLLGRMVIFDRYVYDALMSAHQPMGRLKRIYMWILGHSCPAPDLVLVLDAPGEVMFARKGEDSPEALEAQRQSLLALSGRIPHVQVVDTAREEALVRADVLNRIWSEYRHRWSEHDKEADVQVAVP
jgi:ADP-heptose:LPS heptosyltransferase/O-antigen/teichoic acid export membrane protein/GT2 family glycosyltransferase/thymidylate kinase